MRNAAAGLPVSKNTKSSKYLVKTIFKRTFLQLLIKTAEVIGMIQTETHRMLR